MERARLMATPETDRTVRVSASRGFTDWLGTTGGSLALTTYEAGRILLLSRAAGGGLSLFERDFVRPMGLAIGRDAAFFALATQYQVYRFNDVAHRPAAEGAFDASYVPHVAWTTGSVDAHDVGLDADDRPLFVSTLYSCIAVVSDTRNFRVVWKPTFVSALAAEDRCHLNGMAMVAGRPRYATAVSTTDHKDGWRDHRSDGGVLIDVETDEILVRSLAMPHSPRVFDGRPWLLNSGRGEFGPVDVASGRFEPIAFCPGYARGLAFVGSHAVIGLSAPRREGTFGGLPLDEALRSRGQQPFCGLLVVDTLSGAVTDWLRIDGGGIAELYDVAFLPGVLRPSLVGFKTDEIKQRIVIED